MEEEVEVERRREDDVDGDGIAAGSKPAATRLGSQTGMKPAFAVIAMAFKRTPARARVMPGRPRFAQRAAARIRYAPRSRGSWRAWTIATSRPTASSVA